MRALRFRIGDRWLAVDLAWVREACPFAPPRPVPSAPAWLRGLLDFHGNLVPVIDGGALLGGEAVPARVGARILMLEGPLEGRPDAPLARFGLLVHSVEGVTDIDPAGGWGAHGGLEGLPFISEVLRTGEQGTLLLDAGCLSARHASLLAGTQARALPDAGGVPR